MKLQEIRAEYLGLSMGGEEAIDRLLTSWSHLELAGDLLSLWVADEWARSQAAKPTTPEPRPVPTEVTDGELVSLYTILCKMRTIKLRLTESLIEGLTGGEW